MKLNKEVMLKKEVEMVKTTIEKLRWEIGKNISKRIDETDEVLEDELNKWLRKKNETTTDEMEVEDEESRK
ncbi:hypothetical protein RCL_jg5768.t1 [Rhizophagus clarus]|uniref:Uncharacterized protein n=1 Tax=Rhizophagus clarus TaxID=94130 RepID=A0A8H3M7D7_9GLOM|nr:hypothetical protein RCL_jg5768.t1 [Rhizophagus clarus]